MLTAVGSRSAAGRPLIARSWAKIASIWRTASTASGAGGALPARARSASSKNFRRAWAQQRASVTAPPARVGV